jgi:putative SOS response-associated peptidase YedK
MSGSLRKVNGKRRRAPYVIKQKHGSPLAFAGLWEFWHEPNDPEGEPLRTSVMITTDADRLLVPVHDRMPVVLPPKAWEQWLDPENEDVNGLQKLLGPAPAKEFEAYEISTRVDNVKNGPGPPVPRPSRWPGRRLRPWPATGPASGRTGRAPSPDGQAGHRSD